MLFTIKSGGPERPGLVQSPLFAQGDDGTSPYMPFLLRPPFLGFVLEFTFPTMTFDGVFGDLKKISRLARRIPSRRINFHLLLFVLVYALLLTLLSM